MIQIKEQTKDEKIAMYMKLSKKEIIEMLLANLDLVERLRRIEPHLTMEYTPPPPVALNMFSRTVDKIFSRS